MHRLADDGAVRRIDTSKLKPRKFDKFKATKLPSLLNKLAWGSALHTSKGPKGAGKTL